MARRFEQFLAAPRSEMSESQARELVNQIGSHLKDQVSLEGAAWAKVITTTYSDPGASAIIDETCDVNDLLERNPTHSDRSLEFASQVANSFLTEPHYMSAGNFYEVHRWVTGVLFSPIADTVYEILYRLYLAGWQVLLSDDRVILLKRDDQ